MMADRIGTAGTIGPVRTAKASLWLGLTGVIVIAAGAYGAGAGLFPAPVGLLMVLAGFLLGIVGGLAGLIALFRNRRSGQGRRIFVGLLLSAATLAAVGPWIMRLTSNPSSRNWSSATLWMFSSNKTFIGSAISAGYSRVAGPCGG